MRRENRASLTLRRRTTMGKDAVDMAKRDLAMMNIVFYSSTDNGLVNTTTADRGRGDLKTEMLRLRDACSYTE